MKRLPAFCALTLLARCAADAGWPLAVVRRRLRSLVRARVGRSLTAAASSLVLLLGLGLGTAAPAAAQEAANAADNAEILALPPGIPSNAAAQTQLNSLTVAAESNQGSYDRDLFPHWINVQGNCSARQYVLLRDGSNVQTDSNCQPTSGSWFSEYDGVTEASNVSQIHIDHLVALAEAWRSGAHAWTTSQRQAFANDVNSPQLWAVSASSNTSKSDHDPANWMPSRTAVRCDFTRAWINVKYRYNLSADQAERNALQSHLNNYC